MKVSSVFNFDDRVQIESLNQRFKRSQVLASNIVNAETPGFRSIGYDFEEGLQKLSDSNNEIKVLTSNIKHKKHEFVGEDGSIHPDVYVRPTATVGNDGNTVDLDFEMTELAQNQIIYRATLESLSRKIGIIRYAIQGGR
jgi:flagellar basal-body rod protein FlgB